MSEQELLRTALVLPPRARRVLCVWAAVPGLVCVYSLQDGLTIPVLLLPSALDILVPVP